jgi:iron complex outermembrane receptor protein
MKKRSVLTFLASVLTLGISTSQTFGQDPISGPSPATAAAIATGSITGRVQNLATGEYLENARVAIEGSPGRETFTDSNGRYRLGTIPAGPVRVRVFFTGMQVQTRAADVTAGSTVEHDFNLAVDDTVRLSSFVVTSSREMSASAIAINEQRYAPNVKQVASTDEFGGVSEGNVGEFLRFMPGVAIDYGSGVAREISINGAPSANVPVTIDGFNLASAGGAASGGGSEGYVEIDRMVALNNLSRIEVLHSPTPESPGSALAGSVNLVPRSSFSQVRPTFNGSVKLLMRHNAIDFNKTPGPLDKDTRKVHPAFDFSYVNPVNKRFGFTIAGGYSKLYYRQAGGPGQANFWAGANFATNGGTLPDTTFDKPYLAAFNLRDAWTQAERRTFGSTVDLKIAANDRLTFAFQYTAAYGQNMIRQLRFNVNRVLPGDFDPSFTRGFAGAGNLLLTGSGRYNDTVNYMPTLIWRHDGPLWKAEAGVGLSRASTRFREFSADMFGTTSLQRSGVTVSFADPTPLRPNVITVTDGVTGAPVDPYSLASYSVVNGGTIPLISDDTQRSAYANLRRHLAWRVPFTLKGGFDVRRSVRDTRRADQTIQFVGQDGRASTTPIGNDDSAAPFIDESISQREGAFGFPAIQQISSKKLLAHYLSNPSQFTVNEAATYTSNIANSRYTQETITAAFIRGDLHLFQNRLKLVGGVRAEQTNIKGLGQLNDPTRNIRRDAAGRPILDAAGRPQALTTNALEIARLTRIERGTIARKEYLRYFPSINAGYNLMENLIVRGAYYFSVGRPNFTQYSGGVTLPNVEEAPSPTNRISVNNVGIKAWSARTTKLAIEYYFEGVGLISFGAFRRDFENFFGATVTRATPAFLSLYDLDPSIYGDYDVSTQYNIQGLVRMEGLEFSYKHALAYLPHWARGVQVFVNGNTLRATGANLNSFTGVKVLPRSANGGISLTRETFNLRVNGSYESRQRRDLFAAGRGIEPSTYNWYGKRLTLDLKGEYHFTKHVTAFFDLQNITDAPTRALEIYGPSTPDYAREVGELTVGSLWAFGLKTRF